MKNQCPKWIIAIDVAINIAAYAGLAVWAYKREKAKRAKKEGK